MEEIYTNIYRESRKKAGLEQSEAGLMVFNRKPTSIQTSCCYGSGCLQQVYPSVED